MEFVGKKTDDYEIDFDASNLSSGMYFVRVVSQNEVYSQKILLMK